MQIEESKKKINDLPAYRSKDISFLLHVIIVRNGSIIRIKKAVYRCITGRSLTGINICIINLKVKSQSIKLTSLICTIYVLLSNLKPISLYINPSIRTVGIDLFCLHMETNIIGSKKSNQKS